MKLYQYTPSGNCYKVRLLLSHLGIRVESIEIPLRMAPETARDFRRINRFGRVPALVLDDGEVLAESNAILCYLAEGTPYLPAGRLERARVLSWMFWEQYDHEPYVAVVRSWVRYFGVPPGKERELEERRARAYAALDVMERHLSGNLWLAADRFTIADIALFAYTHVVDEGEMSLDGHPAIRAWIDRVSSQEGHVAIDAA